MYFHGFWVETTGTYTKIRVRIGDNTLLPSSGVPDSNANSLQAAYVHAGVYSALYPDIVDAARANAHTSKPLPDTKLSSGRLGIRGSGGAVTTVGAIGGFVKEFFFEADISPIELERDKLYFLAVKSAMDPTYETGDGTPYDWTLKLYGRQGTGSSLHSLTWTKGLTDPNNVSVSNWDFMPSKAYGYESAFATYIGLPSQTDGASFWFQIVGPQTVAGAPAGPTGPTGDDGDKGR